MTVSDPLLPILSAVARGDERAFARLYESTRGKLFAVCLRILKRRDWAEEALQDSFIRIWDHAAEYRADRSAPLTWMIAIVRHRALDLLRRTEHDAELSDEDWAAWEDPNAGPLELAQASADARALDDCLKRLDPSQRQTIALAFFHGLTHSELAEHLKEPLGTIKTRIRRGLMSLARCLGR